MQQSKRQTVSIVYWIFSRAGHLALTRRKALKTASVLLAFNTRLKAGVNENSPLTRGFDSR